MTDCTRPNDNYDWDKFDAEFYVDHNYRHPLEADKRIASRIVSTLGALPHGWAETGRDVGTGGCLRTAALIAPLMSDSGIFEFCDVGEAQLALTEEGRSAAAQGDLGLWQVHEDAMCEQDNRWRGSTQKICMMGIVRNLSVFELPRHSTQISTSGHCIESMTGDKKEFDEAFGQWAESVVPGGILEILHVIESNGYEVDGVRYPAVRVNPGDIRDLSVRHGLTIIGPDIAIRAKAEESIRKEGDPTSYWGLGAAVMQKQSYAPITIA